MDKEAITIASEQLHGEDFYGKQYGILFDAMVELNDEGKPVDLVTLQQRLKEKGTPPEIYSLEYIRDVMAAVPRDSCHCPLILGRLLNQIHGIHDHLPDWYKVAAVALLYNIKNTFLRCL